MSDLRHLQHQFSAYLQQGGGTVPNNVLGDDKADAKERMDLYAGAYRARLVETLGVDYPGLWSMLGDEQFYQLCVDYIAHHPSNWPSIRWFGSFMADFLRTSEPYNEYSQTAEMAEFEWAQGWVFDAAQAAPMTLQQLASIPAQDWGQIQLQFIPAMRRLDLRWNIPQLWSAIDKEEPEMPELIQTEYPQGWLLWRQQLTPGWRRLDVDEAWAIDSARQGLCFGDICEALLEWVDAENAPLRAVGFIKTWVTHGLVKS